MSSGSPKPRAVSEPKGQAPEGTGLPSAVLPEEEAAPTPSHQVIRVILADSQSIYRVGTKKIFALEDDIRVVAQAENLGQLTSALNKFPCDVLLYEAEVAPNPHETLAEICKNHPNAKLIVLAANPDEEETVEYYRRGVRGLISRAIAPDLLVKCVRKVAGGEFWIDNQSVNWVIEAYRNQAAQLTSPRTKARLSEKELHIISCVTQGMRNKEIAGEIGTTEQVVKNYLRKVYDKLGVSDRLELALYCIHHRLLGGEGASAEATANVAELAAQGAQLAGSKA